ncbi:chromate efflux transporter [Caldilinea sp.]|jgi:chromate transporter|uniref:chromate efflux transporter n=1 Tax=Caldilinea sp. TaxID=2293560 RepID=UPI0021DCB8B9|nr:chromate efflux transporter [Caldilinea sp.]GIV67978.1 MAG: chromate transporter [Caldilinea sp.]
MNPQDARTEPSLQRRLIELAALFLRLGFTAFGGPAAHIAMMHDEVVKRRRWLNDQEFLDLLGATNLIPGPNSTEMAIHIGFRRAGWLGLLIGGACFILPAMGIVMALAWTYVEYGATPAATWLLYGVKPVMVAIVALALLDLGRRAVKDALTLAVGIGAFALYFLQVNEIALLFAGGAVVMMTSNLQRIRQGRLHDLAAPLALFSLPALATTPFNLSTLFFTFLKIGSVLYGSGYVLLAFMRADFVVRLGWLSDQQLLDAIAIGQVTPGPVFTTATFVGFVLGGTPGALVATLGIFLPAFVFVALSSPFIPQLRSSTWFGALLDGVNVASLGLMAAVTVELSRASLIDPLTIGIALVSTGLLIRYKINSTWLVLGGAALGLLGGWM